MSKKIPQIQSLQTGFNAYFSLKPRNLDNYYPIEDLEKTNQEYAEKIGELLFNNPSLLNENPPKELCGKERKKFIKFLKELIYRIFKEIAIIQFLIMQKSSDFGAMREDEISFFFCRILLNIPPNREINLFDYFSFQELVQKTDINYGEKNAEEYRKFLKETPIQIIGVNFSYYFLDDLIKFIDSLNTDFTIYIEYTTKGVCDFIFGKARKSIIHNKKCYIFEKEIIRSPGFILSFAAIAGAKRLVIRKESCESIFYNKWQSFSFKLKKNKSIDKIDIYENIREGLKAMALSYYNVKKKSEIKLIKKVFIADMIDGIVFHELGHYVNRDDIPNHLETFSKPFITTDFVTSVLHENLADWASEKNSLKGAIVRFLEIAKINPTKATGLIYVYLSDNWFIKDKEDFMVLQSEISTALILQFINDDGSIAFDRIELEHNKIYNFLLKFIINILETSYRKIVNGKFKIASRHLNYSQIEKKILNNDKRWRIFQTREELLSDFIFCSYLWSYVNNDSSETKKEIYDFFETEKNNLKREVLKMVTNGHADLFNNSLRNYIFSKYQKIGILNNGKQITFS